MSTFYLLLHFLEKLDLRNMLHCSYFQSVLMPQVPSKQIAFACFEKFYLKSLLGTPLSRSGSNNFGMLIVIE